MIRINKPLTRQISLIFALFVTFSLFIGCGDEGETLKPLVTTEEETRSLVLLAPGKTSDENLEVSLEPEDEDQEFVLIEEDNVLTIGIGENSYYVTVENISGKTLESIKVNYKVKCILNKESKEKNPPSGDQCDGQVIISKVFAVKDDSKEEIECCEDKECEDRQKDQEIKCSYVEKDGIVKKNEVNVDLGDLNLEEKRTLQFVVRLNVEEGKPVEEKDLPPHETSIRNEVCVYYGRTPW